MMKLAATSRRRGRGHARAARAAPQAAEVTSVQHVKPRTRVPSPQPIHRTDQPWDTAAACGPARSPLRVGGLRAGDIVICQVAFVDEQDERSAGLRVEVDVGAEGLVRAAVADLRRPPRCSSPYRTRPSQGSRYALPSPARPAHRRPAQGAGVARHLLGGGDDVALAHAVGREHPATGMRNRTGGCSPAPDYWRSRGRRWRRPYQAEPGYGPGRSPRRVRR